MYQHRNNLSTYESSALKSLMKDDDIVIKQADKEVLLL